MKKTTILIEGKPFTYDDEIDDINYDTISAISEDDARSLLQTTKELFDQCGIRFYLIFGTLLGAVRDHGLIKGDEDVDIYIDSEDLLWKNLPFLYEHGLKVCRVHKNFYYSFHTENKSYIDVYIRGKLPYSIWRLWCDRIASAVIPRFYIRKSDKIDFLGIECLCPHKPERVLRYWYGKTWRTPIRGHSFSYDSPSRHWWKSKAKPRLYFISYCLKLMVTNPLLFLKKISKTLNNRGFIYV